MDRHHLVAMAKALVQDGNGILAADESVGNGFARWITTEDSP